jgi:TnpA family transposase
VSDGMMQSVKKEIREKGATPVAIVSSSLFRWCVVILETACKNVHRWKRRHVRGFINCNGCANPG